jgi:Mg2+-importing ATPase
VPPDGRVASGSGSAPVSGSVVLLGGSLAATEAGTLPAQEVLGRLGTSASGLTSDDAAARLLAGGPNAVRSHHARALHVLARQLRSAILLLLVVTAAASYLVGNQTDAVIIGVILLASVGLGFGNEYRAERAAAGLHDVIRHTTVVLRDGHPSAVDVTRIVVGDVVHLSIGALVPADLRLLSATGLECNEAVLTGESVPVEKSLAPVPHGTPVAGMTSCAFMGTIVSAGTGDGVVVATAGAAEFGRIALGLGERQPETDFQVGLRKFSVLLVQVALVLTSLIFVTNLLLHKPLIESLLFSLAIAVGITPQLLPAVVSTSLAVGSRRLARLRVLVKRIVCIEDLGDLDVLVTDKTGTLTEGRVTLAGALAPDGSTDTRPLLLGLLATESAPASVGPGDTAGNPLDLALVQAPAAPYAEARGYERLGLLPFDHTRRMTSVLVRRPDGAPMMVTKGAPEAVVGRCRDVPAAAVATMQRQFAAGIRLVAVATKAAAAGAALTLADEQDLQLAGFLAFLDPPKATASATLQRLAGLGIAVKVATGDNALVAGKVCAEVGLDVRTTLTGTDVDALEDDALAAAAREATVFARVSPEQKARVVRLLRRDGRAVGFLGDGVNDALALHSADVGISVDTATDVARDAADVILLEKDLGVLADGVVEGRRIFTNTIKYVQMGTSSNFGNMFSAAAASAVLPFLPMLPSQILLNNLLYDTSQLAIPSDRVDEEQLRAPSHWDIGFIRRFMVFFGPLSSLFDFLTFGVLLGVFHAGPLLFRTGWFIESLATQTLVIFAIRTRRSPFWRSRPSRALATSAGATVAVGVALTLSPLSGVLGFTVPPPTFLLVVALMVVCYLALIEYAKRLFYAERPVVVPVVRRRGRTHRVHRRAAAFSHRGPLGQPLARRQRAEVPRGGPSPL